MHIINPLTCLKVLASVLFTGTSALLSAASYRLPDINASAPYSTLQPTDSIPPEAGDDGTRKSRKTLKRELKRLDSLRLTMRKSASEGKLLQWSDSLLRARKLLETGDSLRQQRKAMRLARHDEKLSFLNKLLTAKYFKCNIDTAYISRPAEPWTVRFRGNCSFSLTGIIGENQDAEFSGLWASRYRATLSAGIAYRGISLSAAINPGKLAGKNKDMEYQLASYGNRMGFDIVYDESKTDKGSLTYDETKHDMPKGTLQRQGLAANFYYVFNGRRFSLPAAFTQSYLQRRSAGSWMLGATLQWKRTEIAPPDAVPFEKANLNITNFAVGGGYGHNFCIRRALLLHLSCLPTLVVYNHGKITGAGTTTRARFYLWNSFVTMRAALLYSWKHQFAGVSGTSNFANTGNERHLEFYYIKWRARIFYGFRF